MKMLYAFFLHVVFWITVRKYQDAHQLHVGHRHSLNASIHFQEDVQAIVMLCDFVEDGEVKCTEYFPVTVGETAHYGEITVKNEKSEESVQSILCQRITIQIE